jgi:hypothetical protein
MATQFAQEAGQYTKPVEVPKEYQQHAKVFNEAVSNRFPPSQSWDHVIELKKMPQGQLIAKSTQLCQLRMKPY